MTLSKVNRDLQLIPFSGSKKMGQETTSPAPTDDVNPEIVLSAEIYVKNTRPTRWERCDVCFKVIKGKSECHLKKVY